jgi:glycosyltransferase involved in cell wall biosynthesis
LKRDIFTVTRRIGHHAARSGYDILADYVGVPVQPPKWFLNLRGLGRVQSYMRKRSGMEWYNGLAMELFTALHMRKHRNAIYHFLFGENDYRYIQKFAPKLDHKIVCTFHSPPDEFARVMKQLEHLSHLDAAIVVASNQKPMLDALLGTENVFVVPHGIETSHFTPGNDEVQPRVCLCVGHHHRDLDTLCELASILKTEDPEVRLILIDRVFSTYRTGEEQRRFLEKFELLGNIQRRENVSDRELLSLYRTTSLLLLPLTDTTANISLLEALSCGLPVVATDVGGIRDYVDLDCAALTPPKDAKTMAEKVLQILDDSSLRLRMSEASRQRALLFDWKVIAEQLQSVYANI